MEEIKTTVKKWGNSFGIIIPKDFIEKEKLKEGSQIIVNIDSKEFMTVGEVLKLAKKNKLKRPKENVEKSFEEIDKELWEK